jgi:hypothetical protein
VIFSRETHVGSRLTNFFFFLATFPTVQPLSPPRLSPSSALRAPRTDSSAPRAPQTVLSRACCHLRTFLLCPPEPSTDRLQRLPPHFRFRACSRLQSLLELAPTLRASCCLQSLRPLSRLSDFVLQSLRPSTASREPATASRACRCLQSFPLPPELAAKLVITDSAGMYRQGIPVVECFVKLLNCKYLPGKSDWYTPSLSI